MDKDFSFSLVPDGWALCYLSECGRKEECLRYQACLLSPKGKTQAACVLPAALRQGACPHFHPIEKMRMAAGFQRIFDELKAKHVASITSKLIRYLGPKTTYYRYRCGERSLTPKQQEWILALLRSYGYTEGVAFDSYSEGYRFSF